MQALSWLLRRLSVETQRHHAQADADRWELVAPATLPSYRRYLCTVYGFEARLETALAFTPGLEIRFLQPRLKAGRIAADLLALGLDAPESALLARRFSIAPFRCVAEAMGWVYVVERNTLHLDDVRAHLVKQIPRELARGSAYLTFYDGAAAVRWRELGARLDRIGAVPHAADQVVEAAHAAFGYQRQWFRSCAAGTRTDLTASSVEFQLEQR